MSKYWEWVIHLPGQVLDNFVDSFLYCQIGTSEEETFALFNNGDSPLTLSNTLTDLPETNINGYLTDLPLTNMIPGPQEENSKCHNRQERPMTSFICKSIVVGKFLYVWPEF